MPLTDEQIAELEAKAAKAAELENKLKDFESKAKGYEEVKADMLRYKAQLSEKADADAKAERERLEKQGEFKTLLEKAEAEKLTLSKKADDAEELAQRFIRFSALKEEAAKAGIRAEALSDLSFLPISKLEIQRDGQNITVKGAEALIAETKKNKPHWFADAKAPQFDGGKGGSSKPGEMSLVELQKKDPEAYAIRLAAIVAGKV